MDERKATNTAFSNSQTRAAKAKVQGEYKEVNYLVARAAKAKEASYHEQMWALRYHKEHVVKRQHARETSKRTRYLT